MDSDIKRLLLMYAVPVAVLSLVIAFFAPPLFSVAILSMLSLSALLVIGMAFLVDYLDNRD